MKKHEQLLENVKKALASETAETIEEWFPVKEWCEPIEGYEYVPLKNSSYPWLASLAFDHLPIEDLVPEKTITRTKLEKAPNGAFLLFCKTLYPFTACHA